jgi:hypothetical protein
MIVTSKRISTRIDARVGWCGAQNSYARSAQWIGGPTCEFRSEMVRAAQMLLVSSSAQGYYGAAMKPAHPPIAVPKSEIDKREKEWPTARKRKHKKAAK